MNRFAVALARGADGAPTAFRLAATVIVVLGLALRICGARGDLWMDEITSLRLVEPLHSPGKVFLLAHDNNHFLNSFYLWFTGPAAAPQVQRAFSILLGTATVAAAGIVLAPAGRGAALLGMLLFAVSFPMVNYGSEARGYAGLILCTVLAIHYLDRQLAVGGHRLKFGLAAAFGMLMHLNMIAAATTLGLFTLARAVRHARSMRAALAATVFVFEPALYLVTPVALLLLLTVVRSHGLHFGYLKPFTPADFISGYGGIIKVVIGVPDPYPSWTGLLVAVAAALLCLRWGGPGNSRPDLYASLTLGLPAALFLVHMPNAEVRRYFLTSGTAFLLCSAELAAMAWKKGIWSRGLATLALGGVLAGNAVSLFMFLNAGRGHYSDAVRVMASKGPASYGGTGPDWSNTAELSFYASRTGVPLQYVPLAQSCATPPEWVIAKSGPYQSSGAYGIVWGLPACRMDFTRVDVFPAWGMSGNTVTLYLRRKS